MLDEKSFLEMQEKARKWDSLGDEIAKCYAEEGDDDFDKYEREADLLTIGKLAASAYGWI